MSKWRTEKHFCSWLGLAPHNDITGGKVIRSHTLNVHNRAAQALRLAAQLLSRSQSALWAHSIGGCEPVWRCTGHCRYRS